MPFKLTSFKLSTLIGATLLWASMSFVTLSAQTGFAEEAPIPGSTYEGNGWYFEDNFGYYYASPETLGETTTSGWIYSEWTDWVYITPRKENGAFWFWHAKLGWGFMGAQVPDYIWLSASQQWIFFINENPSDAYFYSFTSAQWVAFNEIPIDDLKGLSNFIADVSDSPEETFRLTIDSTGKSGTFYVNETATVDGITANIILEGRFSFEKPLTTLTSGTITLYIDWYELSARSQTFSGNAQYISNLTSENVPDEVIYDLSFTDETSGSYVAELKLNGSFIGSETGTFDLE